MLSISLSLVAAFIPLLLMGGLIGRIFREFALTVTASIAVSVLVSLTLAPMLSARCMREAPAEHGRLFGAIEAGFNALLSGYRRTLDVVLRHQAITLAVFFATLALTVAMAVQMPKGFFPLQDTGLITAVSEGGQDISPDRMMRLQRELGAVILATQEHGRCRPGGSQIRERFSGMEMTDEVHWRDYYERDGSFRSRGMGRTRFGRWSVQENELCVDLVPGTDSGCFEVWLSAKKVELRPTGLGLRLEGVLQKPTERN